MGAVRIEHIEVCGWEAPHELKIRLVGNIDKQVDDDIMPVMRKYGREFQAAVAEAFERVFLTRLENDEYRRADRKRPASGTATIEDIEL